MCVSTELVCRLSPCPPPTELETLLGSRSEHRRSREISTGLAQHVAAKRIPQLSWLVSAELCQTFVFQTSRNAAIGPTTFSSRALPCWSGPWICGVSYGLHCGQETKTSHQLSTQNVASRFPPPSAVQLKLRQHLADNVYTIFTTPGSSFVGFV